MRTCLFIGCYCDLDIGQKAISNRHNVNQCGRKVRRKLQTAEHVWVGGGLMAHRFWSLKGVQQRKQREQKTRTPHVTLTWGHETEQRPIFSSILMTPERFSVRNEMTPFQLER